MFILYVSRTHEQDNGRTVWYFSAPEKFLGEKAFAHNGKLSFRLGYVAALMENMRVDCIEGHLNPKP